ncbi:MAG: threonylcarbamoyl-AMP synthase [Clostridiales bacterium]|nr:threonylcarbamoyl-AMP synthase [Clostridiales bacterium]
MIILDVNIFATKDRIVQTEILKPTDLNIMRCASKLKAGELVAFPTETVYALGAVATDGQAVKKVFEVKKRPMDKPLIVAVAKKSDIKKVVKSIPEKAQILIDRFMPGALTLVFDRADVIPDEVTAGSDSVAVRIPDNAVAQKLIELAGAPVVVPSANTSDKASPTLAQHVKDDLDGKIEYILDGGASEIGIESTIVDMRTEPPTVLRAGGVTVEQLRQAIGEIKSKREDAKLSGYMPNAEVLFSAYYDGMTDNICKRYDELTAQQKKVAVLCLDGNRGAYGDREVFTVGDSYEAYAHNLFAVLRNADGEHYDAVIAEGVNPVGLGESLIARLIKLSGGLII